MSDTGFPTKTPLRPIVKLQFEDTDFVDTYPYNYILGMEYEGITSGTSGGQCTLNLYDSTGKLTEFFEDLHQSNIALADMLVHLQWGYVQGPMSGIHRLYLADLSGRVEKTGISYEMRLITKLAKQGLAKRSIKAKYKGTAKEILIEILVSNGVVKDASRIYFEGSTSEFFKDHTLEVQGNGLPLADLLQHVMRKAGNNGGRIFDFNYYAVDETVRFFVVAKDGPGTNLVNINTKTNNGAPFQFPRIVQTPEQSDSYLLDFTHDDRSWLSVFFANASTLGIRAEGESEIQVESGEQISTPGEKERAPIKTRIAGQQSRTAVEVSSQSAAVTLPVATTDSVEPGKDAERVAQAQTEQVKNQAARQAVTCQAQFVGNPYWDGSHYLMGGSRINFAIYNPLTLDRQGKDRARPLSRLSSDYSIKKVVHKISNGVYTTDIEAFAIAIDEIKDKKP